MDVGGRDAGAGLGGLSSLWSPLLPLSPWLLLEVEVPVVPALAAGLSATSRLAPLCVIYHSAATLRLFLPTDLYCKIEISL